MRVVKEEAVYLSVLSLTGPPPGKIHTERGAVNAAGVCTVSADPSDPRGARAGGLGAAA